MTSRHLVDPELLHLIDAAPPVPADENMVAALRARRIEVPPFDPAGTALERLTLSLADGGGVLLHIYRPEAPAGPMGAILHMHGGGFVTGTAASVEHRHRALVRELSCVLVAVDYRFAPEVRHPVPLEDCHAAFAWLHDHADRLGVDRDRIGVMGESAGGTLAAALALLCQERGAFRPAFQHLVYPALDDRTGTGATPPFAGEFGWTTAHNRRAWAAYLGRAPGGSDTPPLAAPARATDLAGLPPTFIATGALDLFVDENIAYARRLIAAGVPTELHVYPGAFHGFDRDTGPAIAARFHRDRLDALRRALSQD